MSHFAVLVAIPKDGKQLSEIMAPFYEQTDDPQYLAFRNKAEDPQVRENYETLKTKRIRLADGTVIDTTDPRINYVRDAQNPFETIPVLPEGAEMVSVSFKEIYPTFQDFLEAFYEFDEKAQAWGYWYNPNAKWDYYQDGYEGLLLKQPATIESIKNGLTVTTRPSAQAQQFTNTANAGSIDWAFIKNKRRDEELEGFKHYHAAWLWAKDNPTQDQKIIDLMRAEYEREDPSGVYRRESFTNLEEYIQACSAIIHLREDKEDPLAFWHPVGEFKNFMVTEEEYIAAHPAPDALIFAYISPDGQWHEEAMMGSFAMTGPKTNLNFNAEFWQMVESLPADAQVLILDCHI